MKKLVLITTTAILLMVAGGCSTGQMASTGVYYDDIYYAPDLTQDNREQAFAPVPSIVKEEEKQRRSEDNRQIREYERSDLAREQQDIRDFSEVQNKYASVLADEQYEEVDSLIYYDDETGYWVDGFDGSRMERDYAERLIRFHGPFTRISYSSPLYTQFVYFNDPDWNVYVDGYYAYAIPTWTNPWYNSYRYNRWNSPWGHSFGYNSFWGYSSHHYYGYGMYDPFYNPYPYYGGGYYGSYYNRPYYGYGGYGNYPYHHSYYSSNKESRDVYRGIRPSMSSNTRYSSGSRNSNTLKSSDRQDSRSNASRTRTIRNSDGSTTVVNTSANTQRAIRGNATLKSGEESASQRSRSVSRYQGSGASSGTVQSGTRRSSTPTYSQPGNASKPSYNRTSSYTRPAATNSQTRPVSRSGSSLKSGSDNRTTQQPAVRSRATRSYNSGSSTQQRNQVQSRSYTPTRSSSSSSSSGSVSSSPSRSRSTSTYSPSSSSSSGSRSSGSSSSSSRSGSTVRSGRR